MGRKGCGTYHHWQNECLLACLPILVHISMTFDDDVRSMETKYASKGLGKYFPGGM